HAAAAGEVGEADSLRIADDDGYAAVVDAEQLRADIGDAGPRAADIGMARGDDDVAVLGDVDLRGRFAAGVEPEARGNAAATQLARRRAAERRCVVRMVLRGFDRFDVADTRIGRTVRRLGALLRAVLQTEVERIHPERFRELV